MMDTTEPAAQVQTRFRRLKVVAFLCGAVLMSLEMAGVRVLNVYFGSTIYVWGAIIGIFLGSLSLGYWLGGRLADRAPRMSVLGGIVCSAGILTFLIPWISGPLCSALVSVEGLDPRLRAVVGSIILYAVPSVLMGMVSPFAVRLAARRVTRIGTVAGSLYSLSTLGSIVGTFLVSFVLTEVLGTKMIVWSIAVTLVLVSTLCLLETLRARSVSALAAGCVLAVPGWYAARVPDVQLHFPEVADGRAIDGGPADEIIHSEESVYHAIHIVKGRELLTPRRSGRALLMMFNNQVESGILLDDSGEVAMPLQTAAGYTRLLHLGVLFTEVAPRRTLVVGAGGGIAPQNFIEDYGDANERIDVVDIDPVVFELAREYFFYPREGESEVIHSHVEDGRIYLTRNPDARWDYVILDAYSSGGRIPRHLITKEFFELLRERTTRDGVVVANVISATDGEMSRLYRAVFKTLDAVFPNVYAFPRRGRTVRRQNILFVATNNPERLTSREIIRRYNRLEGRLLKRPGLGGVVRGVNVVPPDTEEAPLLTDDFCPTDSMTSF
jgi:spermidine synthase